MERYLELENLLNPEENPQYFYFEKVISNADDAELAARQLRNKWKLGYEPIPDVVSMLEDKGYKVIEIDATVHFDGLSAKANGQNVIVLNRKLFEGNNTRKRFTALHELAHQSLRFSGQLSQKETEKLCHLFAGAVLYPEEMARKELHSERFHFYENEPLFLCYNHSTLTESYI